MAQLREINGQRHAAIVRRHQHQRVGHTPWENMYKSCDAPLVVDLGCGAGRGLLLLARRQHQFNYLGVEIRQGLVMRANKWAAARGLSHNVHYVFGSSTSLDGDWLRSYPGGIHMITIQFPDPPYKKRPRILDEGLVATMVDVLGPGGRIFIQSDVEEVLHGLLDEIQATAGPLFELCHETSLAAAWASTEGMGKLEPCCSLATDNLPAGGHHSTQQYLGAYSCHCTVEKASNGPQVPIGSATCGLALCSGTAADRGDGDFSAHDINDVVSGRIASRASGIVRGVPGSFGTEPAPSGSPSLWSHAPGLTYNPLGAPTEREYWVTRGGRPTYRAMLIRTRRVRGVREQLTCQPESLPVTLIQDGPSGA